MVKSFSVLSTEMLGTIFIILLGSALHFTYASSGNNAVVGSFSPVNESVWEHLKMVFWPSFFWILIAKFPLRSSISNFFSAKTIGTYVMVITIPAVFYSYTALVGQSILAIDIVTFIIAVIIGQFVSYKLFKFDKVEESTERIALVALLLLAAFFVVFTFYPPHLPIFQDSITGQYGA